MAALGALSKSLKCTRLLQRNSLINDSVNPSRTYNFKRTRSTSTAVKTTSRTESESETEFRVETNNSTNPNHNVGPYKYNTTTSVDIRPRAVLAISQSSSFRPSKTNIELSFCDYKEAYRSKSTYELVRALLVLKLCQFDFLVERNKEVIRWSQKILGRRLFKAVMKASFYGHFVAGEDQPSIAPLVKKINNHGVGAILDYSVEEDIPHSKAVEAEMESCTSHGKETPTADKDRHRQFKAYRKFADRREDVASARTYFYHDEAKCDDNLDTLLKCIDVAGATSDDGFAAVKLTALGRPQLLLNLSEVLTQTRSVFMKMAGCGEGSKSDVLEQRLNRDEFQRQLHEMGITSRDDTGEWFTWMDKNKTGSIDLLDWDRLMQPDLKLSKLLKVPKLERGKLCPYFLTLTDEEEVQMKRMLQRIDILAKRAAKQKVRLMIDAEQTYFQPAIARLAIEMMRKFNKEKAVIFNTYQCYLRQSSNNVAVDLELSKREDFWFGAKLVRGAYMDQERKRAGEIGYPDPINESYEATSRCYHGCLENILQEIYHRPKINVMVASHNEDTIRFAVKRMEELDIGAKDRLVYFGQLLGMCDQVSFTLGQAGYAVYKYVPYGPVDDVIPYLSRRAHENRGMLQGVSKEKQLLWMELKRRILHRD